MERRALVALATLLLLTGCTQPVSSVLAESNQPVLSSSQREQPNDLFHAPADLEELTSKLREASYLIECGNTYGSGFGYSIFVGTESQDFIVTTKTVVESCLRAKVDPVVSDSDWGTFSAQVLATEKSQGTSTSFAVSMDVAILKPKKNGIATFEDEANKFQIGSWVMTGSFPHLNPDYSTWAVTHGTLASNLHNLGYAISLTSHPGSNGGVVLNSRGEVVGIRYTPNSKELPGLSHMLPIRQALTLLEEVREKLAEFEAELRLG